MMPTPHPSQCFFLGPESCGRSKTVTNIWKLQCRQASGKYGVMGWVRKGGGFPEEVAFALQLEQERIHPCIAGSWNRTASDPLRTGGLVEK